MTPKPMSKEQLEEIRPRLIQGFNDYASELIEGLLTAEQYWREAVKKIEPFIAITVRDGATALISPQHCMFCGQSEHKPDCPWLLAQGYNIHEQ